MEDSGSRHLALVGAAAASPAGPGLDEGELVEPGLADVVTLQRRAAAGVSADDEQAFFADTLAEYAWARDVAGLAPSTLQRPLRPVEELCSFTTWCPGT
ncbi:hypothetical protein AB0I39_30510 [Kitasatospora purpeofusca]|uniref:hypothetical protein n=1 Tax=Kitasatospora purpeofusca TaxID=67352 RepID=UPI0033CCFBBB